MQLVTVLYYCHTTYTASGQPSEPSKISGSAPAFSHSCVDVISPTEAGDDSCAIKYRHPLTHTGPTSICCS